MDAICAECKLGCESGTGGLSVPHLLDPLGENNPVVKAQIFQLEGHWGGYLL